MKWMSLHVAERETTRGNTLIKERRSASYSSRLSWQQLKLLYILYIGHAGKNKPVFIYLALQVTWYSGPYHNEHKGRAEFALNKLQANRPATQRVPFVPYWPHQQIKPWFTVLKGCCRLAHNVYDLLQTRIFPLYAVQSQTHSSLLVGGIICSKNSSEM